MADILDGLDRKCVNEFKKDFKEVIRVTVGIDKEFAKSSKKIDDYWDGYEKVISQFNKKYSGLKLKVIKKIDSIRLHIFIKENKVIDVFSKAASKIAGLKSVGASGFSEKELSPENVQAELDKVKNRLYLSYFGDEGSSDTVFLEHMPKQKMVELHYNSGISEEEDPEFELCCYYAVKDGCKKIDVRPAIEKIGFFDLLTDTETREWLDKFNPRMEE